MGSPPKPTSPTASTGSQRQFRCPDSHTSAIIWCLRRVLQTETADRTVQNSTPHALDAAVRSTARGTSTVGNSVQPARAREHCGIAGYFVSICRSQQPGSSASHARQHDRDDAGSPDPRPTALFSVEAVAPAESCLSTNAAVNHVDRSGAPLTWYGATVHFDRAIRTPPLG